MLVIYAKYKENRMEIAEVSNPLIFTKIENLKSQRQILCINFNENIFSLVRSIQKVIQMIWSF